MTSSPGPLPRELAIETRGLSRKFGDFVAVDGLELAVPAGSLYGFLGPNGAGKSTTIRCLTGLLSPSAGEIRILGLDFLADPIAVKRRIGVVPEDLALFDRLTGAETLEFSGRIHGLDAAARRARSAELLAVMDLESATGVLVADYSHGMKKKLSLAVAMLHAPRLLFLDEPFEGVDAIASRQIRDILSRFARHGGTAFLTTHILEIVERLCDHVGVIHKGRLVTQASMSDIREGGGGARSLEETFLSVVGASGPASDALEWLSG